MYTTANGPAMIPLSQFNDSAPSLPGDYDFATVNTFWNPSGAGPAVGADNQRCDASIPIFSHGSPTPHCSQYLNGNNAPFTLTADEPTYLNFFVNTVWTVSCDDNTCNSTNPRPDYCNSGVGLETGNVFDPNVYPDRAPSFGVMSISTKTIVTQNYTDAPVAESYAVSPIPGHLGVNGSRWNWGALTVFTVILVDDVVTDVFMAGDARECSATGCPYNDNPYQWVEATQQAYSGQVPFNSIYGGGPTILPGFSVQGGYYNMSVGMVAQSWDHNSQITVRDRIFTGFKRTSDYSTVLTAHVMDGPDCGTVVMDCPFNSNNCHTPADYANVARGCLGAGVSIPYYVVQLPR